MDKQFNINGQTVSAIWQRGSWSIVVASKTIGSVTLKPGRGVSATYTAKPNGCRPVTSLRDLNQAAGIVVRDHK